MSRPDHTVDLYRPEGQLFVSTRGGRFFALGDGGALASPTAGASVGGGE